VLCLPDQKSGQDRYRSNPPVTAGSDDPHAHGSTSGEGEFARLSCHWASPRSPETTPTRYAAHDRCRSHLPHPLGPPATARPDDAAPAPVDSFGPTCPGAHNSREPADSGDEE